MKLKKLSIREWTLIITAIILLILVVSSWDRVSSKITEVFKIYTNVEK